MDSGFFLRFGIRQLVKLSPVETFEEHKCPKLTLKVLVATIDALGHLETG